MRRRRCKDRGGKGVIPDHFGGARRSACFRAPVECWFWEKESQVWRELLCYSERVQGRRRLIRRTESSPYCVLLPGFD